MPLSGQSCAPGWISASKSLQSLPPTTQRVATPSRSKSNTSAAPCSSCAARGTCCSAALRSRSCRPSTSISAHSRTGISAISPAQRPRSSDGLGLRACSSRSIVSAATAPTTTVTNGRRSSTFTVCQKRITPKPVASSASPSGSTTAAQPLSINRAGCVLASGSLVPRCASRPSPLPSRCPSSIAPSATAGLHSARFKARSCTVIRGLCCSACISTAIPAPSSPRPTVQPVSCRASGPRRRVGCSRLPFVSGSETSPIKNSPATSASPSASAPTSAAIRPG